MKLESSCNNFHSATAFVKYFWKKLKTFFVSQYNDWCCMWCYRKIIWKSSKSDDFQTMQNCSFFTLWWSIYSIWRNRIWSAIVQVAACGMTAPSHLLNHCWLIINNACGIQLWAVSEGMLKLSVLDMNWKMINSDYSHMSQEPIYQCVSGSQILDGRFDAETFWLSVCKRHFQIHSVFHSNVIKFDYYGSNWQKVSNNEGGKFVKQQPIARTNDM